MGLIQSYKLFHKGGNYKQNKKTSYRMRENIANYVTDKDLTSKIHK